MNTMKEKFVIEVEEYGAELCEHHYNKYMTMTADTLIKLEDLSETFEQIDVQPELEQLESSIVILSTFMRHLERGNNEKTKNIKKKKPTLV